MTICTGKQRMTIQKLRRALGLSLLSKNKLDTMSTAVCSQMIEDYLKLLNRINNEDYASHAQMGSGVHEA